MMLFGEKEISVYLASMIEVDNSFYGVVPYESDVEKQFAEAMATLKIQCGKAHFAALGVDYDHVVRADEV